MADSKVFPAELILDICSYLSQKDVANFRLSCKRHAELGAEHLVKELHVMFRPKSFQNLIMIASHPVFPKHVHSIFYEADIAHFAIDQKIWKHHVTPEKRPFPLPKGPSEPDEDYKTSVSRSLLSSWEAEQEAREIRHARQNQKYTKAQISRGWSAFKHIQEETGSLAQSNEDLKAMIVAFGSFPNLTEVRMQIEGPSSDAMKASFKKALYLPSHDILPSMLEDEERGFHVGTRQLSAILEATVASKIQLKSLIAGKLNWSYFGDEHIRYEQVEGNKRYNFENDFWAKPYEKRLQPAFHNLTNIDFRFESLLRDEDLMDDLEEERRHTKLGVALKSARNLESLAMHFGDTEEDMYYDGDPGPHVKLSKLVGGSSLDRVVWPQLKFLELHSVSSTFEGWMSFMEKHSPTLETLCLCSLHLHSQADEIEDEDLMPEEDDEPPPSWSRLLTALREILHGKHIEFRGVFSVEEEYMLMGEIPEHRDDEGWLGMDREVMVPVDDSKKAVRFGQLVQQWFVDDLGTANNPITKYRHEFKLEGDDDDEYGMDDDDEDEDEDDFFPGSHFHPFAANPIIPQMIFQHLMSGFHSHPMGHAEDDDDDDDSLPELIGLDSSLPTSTHTGAANEAEDDADSLPDLLDVD